MYPFKDGHFSGEDTAGAVTSGGYGNVSGGSGLLTYNGTPVICWDNTQMYPNTPSGISLGTVAYPERTDTSAVI